MMTPDDDRMFGSLVAIRFKKDAKAAFDEIGRKKIWISGTGAGQVRLSAHIHTRPRDIHEFFDIIESKMGKA